MTKEDLVEAAYQFTGGNLKELSLNQVKRLMTVAMYVGDLCLNEIEDRGELEFVGDAPVLPYDCDYTVPTVLTR